MKNKLTILLFLIFSTIALAQNFHDITIESITGEELSMSEFKGKYILVVNVASRCGYTKQYADLEKLYQLYDNLVILGVPCNQFANQEPLNEEGILQFCSSKYNVTFPMTSKVNVKGKDKHPLYQWLTEKDKNKVDDIRISWNFNKFLVDPNGKFIKHFGSSIKPLNEEISSLIK